MVGDSAGDHLGRSRECLHRLVDPGVACIAQGDHLAVSGILLGIQQSLAAGEHLVSHHRQRELVGLWLLATFVLLGRHILWRAQAMLILQPKVLVAGRAQVDQQRIASGVHQNISRLHIAVNHRRIGVDVVQIVQRLGGMLHHTQGLRRRHPIADRRGQIVAISVEAGSQGKRLVRGDTGDILDQMRWLRPLIVGAAQQVHLIKEVRAHALIPRLKELEGNLSTLRALQPHCPIDWPGKPAPDLSADLETAVA